MKVLVVEDDDRVAAALRIALVKHGFEVRCAATGAAAMESLRDHPDLILLDIGLPDRDGMSVCREIRGRSSVPIIMTTARGALAARVAGLDLGADDYLVKPYNLVELVARIRAVARRYAMPDAGAPDDEAPARPDDPERLVIGPLQIDLEAWTAAVGDTPLALTRKEFDLLLLLARHPGEVLAHGQLADEVWPDRPPHVRRTLHVHISALRHKIGDQRLIETVHGVGYRLVVLGPGAH